MKKITFTLATVLLLHGLLAQDRVLVNQSGDVVATRRQPDTTDAKWLNPVPATQPVPGTDFDPATHKAVDSWAVNGPNWEQSWAVVALTQQELDFIAAESARDTKRTNVRNAVATLRQWAVDAQGTNVNSGNNNSVTQTMVDRTGVFFDRFADMIEAEVR